jgi:hypothetical protein
MVVDFNPAMLSGGYRRNYQILRFSKGVGIEAVIVTSKKSCENAERMFQAILTTFQLTKCTSKAR